MMMCVNCAQNVNAGSSCACGLYYGMAGTWCAKHFNSNRIYWHFDDSIGSKCEIVLAPQYKHIQLNYSLPYDITLEKLKKLLVLL
jgi:hypothetical protein